MLMLMMLLPSLMLPHMTKKKRIKLSLMLTLILNKPWLLTLRPISRELKRECESRRELEGGRDQLQEREF